MARSSLATAEGLLQSSEENFERVVGARAGMLEPLPPLPPLPPTADQAVETAVAENSVVASFVARARAAGYDVAGAKAERLPTISAVGTTAYINALGTADRALGLPKGTLPNSQTDTGQASRCGFRYIKVGRPAPVCDRLRKPEPGCGTVDCRRAARRGGRRAGYAIWQSALRAITANEWRSRQ